MAAAHNNESRASNYTFVDDYFIIIEKDVAVYSAHLFAVSLVGTALNVWFLIALLSSPTVRSRLRNKVICNSYVLHIVECFLIMLVYVLYRFSGFTINCLVQMMLDHLALMVDLAANWLLVILLSVFLAQIQDFNPSTRLSSANTTLGTVALLVIPWIASLVIVPVIIHEYNKYFSYPQCFSQHPDNASVFRSIDTAVPILLAILLAVTAAVLKYRRFHVRNSTSSMQVELIGRGPEIDNVWVYISAVVVSAVCDVPRWIMLNNYFLAYGEVYPTLYYIFVTEILTNLRPILMPITWLLLPDIRQRIKTWRPWYRPSPGIDLTLVYTKDQTTEEVK